MNLELVTNVLLGIALLVWIGYRQLNWVAVGSRMWTMPAILAVVGIFTLGRSGITTIPASDIGLLLLELALSIGVGVVMGVLARFRPITAPTLAKYRARASRKADAAEPTLETRTGILGFALWLVLIAARIGIDLWAHSAGSVLASTGVILVMVAVNRATRVLVITQRVARYAPVAA